MLYVIYVDINDKSYVGIKKKILAQVRVFEKEFGKVFYTTYSGQIMYLMSGDDVVEKNIALTVQECNKSILKWIDKYHITKTYIRYNFADKWFLWFLQEQKKRKIVSVLEFPTIPYDGEVSNKRILFEDGYYRKTMYQYIDQCSTYADCDKVFEIPCIPLLNGVDISEHPLKKQRKRDGKVVLLAVAAMAKWHGYERVIKGMAEYYNGSVVKEIIFKLVGEGPETIVYKSLVEKYKLQEYVKFCGKLEKTELNKQYDEADIAIGTLGNYKKGLVRGAPIKTSEYCIRGIPFIYGYHDTGLNGNEYFAMQVSNSDENIRMKEVLRFYDEVITHDEYSNEMRSYAEKKYLWDEVLKPVIEYYISRCSCVAD